MLSNSNALPIETSHTSLVIFEKLQLLVNMTGLLSRKLVRCMLQMNQRWNLKSRETVPTLSIYKTFFWKSSKIWNNRQHQFELCDWRRNSTRHASFCQQYSPFNIFGLHYNCPSCESLSCKWTFCHKAFIETEFSHNLEAKTTWLECQGYNYESNPSTHTLTAFTKREAETRSSATVTLFG